MAAAAAAAAGRFFNHLRPRTAWDVVPFVFGAYLGIEHSNYRRGLSPIFPFTPRFNEPSPAAIRVKLFISPDTDSSGKCKMWTENSAYTDLEGSDLLAGGMLDLFELMREKRDAESVAKAETEKDQGKWATYIKAFGSSTPSEMVDRMEKLTPKEGDSLAPVMVVSFVKSGGTTAYEVEDVGYGSKVGVWSKSLYRKSVLHSKYCKKGEKKPWEQEACH